MCNTRKQPAVKKERKKERKRKKRDETKIVRKLEVVRTEE